jgi:hypothetical protein
MGKGVSQLKHPLATAGLSSLYVGCGEALRSILNLKADRLTLLQGLEAAILNGAEVNKHVISIISGYETEALAFVKPFDFALHHRAPPPFLFFSRTDYDDAQKKPLRFG